MRALDAVAEQRIAEAAARGDLDGLPGAGRPLPLDEDACVPAELRLAYRVLKNAGYVPAEVGLRREIAEVEDLLRALPDAAAARGTAARRLDLLRARLAAVRGGEGGLLAAERYHGALLERLGREG